MAYNPFSVFRRNQKAIFAVITVFIMFTFVLSSGLGGGADFFDWLPQWIGKKGRKGDQLCTIDGTKIYTRDADQLRIQRTMASKFMAFAAQETVGGMQQRLRDLMAQGSPKLQMYFQLAMQNPMFAAGMPEMIAKDPDAKQADKDAAKTMEAMISISRTAGRISMVPNRTTRDQIEFMIWDKKAKELGIEYTEDDVGTLLEREFLGQFKSEVEVRKALQRDMQGFNLEVCKKAMAAEFRVRAAQIALMGTSVRGDQTLTAPPVFTPPYEQFKYFQEKTSPTTYQFLAVPAAAYVGKVTQTPTDDELRRLFEDRKDYEPDPAKEEPGFRDPRKVKVEWVSVTGEEPYYRAKAAEWQKLTEQIAKSEVKALVVAVPGFGPGTWAALAIATPAVKEPLVHSEYQHKVREHELHLDTRWDRPSFASLLGPLYAAMDTSVVRPQNLAATAGGAAGALLGFGGPVLPGTLLMGATVHAEQRGRIRLGMPLVLGLVPTPGMLPTLVAGDAVARKNTPEPLPIEAYKTDLMKELIEKRARELAVEDLKKLKEEVDKLTDNGKSKDKSGAKAHIADFIKTRGIKTGASTELHSEWTIGDDPGLAPLKTVLDKSESGSNPHAAFRPQAPIQFGQKFFWSSDPRTGAREPVTGTYRPEFYPERAAETAISPFAVKSDPVFLAWRTVEEPAKPAPSIQVARPRVLEAWKRLEARKIAKAEAEWLANELRAKPGDSSFAIDQNLRDMQAQIRVQTADPKIMEKVKLFEVKNVAPLAISMDFTSPRPGGTVEPFKLAASNDLPYPTPEMEKLLLDERTKPVKSVYVQADQAKDTFYVIALVARREHEMIDYRPHLVGGRPDQVLMQVQRDKIMESGNKARESILGLLKKEFKYEETEEQKKKLDEREKKGGDEG